MVDALDETVEANGASSTVEASDDTSAESRIKPGPTDGTAASKDAISDAVADHVVRNVSGALSRCGSSVLLSSVTNAISFAL
eukprot:7072482-Prymnesium_polylepis.2